MHLFKLRIPNPVRVFSTDSVLAIDNGSGKHKFKSFLLELYDFHTHFREQQIISVFLAFVACLVGYLNGNDLRFK